MKLQYYSLKNTQINNIMEAKLTNYGLWQIL